MHLLVQHFSYASTSHWRNQQCNCIFLWPQATQEKKSTNQPIKIQILLHCREPNIQIRSIKITMIHAYAISIVRAVGVTKTVSHPYGFQWEILLLKPVGPYQYKNKVYVRTTNMQWTNDISHQISPVLHEDIQNLLCFGCEETGYGLLHWLYISWTRIIYKEKKC